jgi:hypothetical protein
MVFNGTSEHKMDDWGYPSFWVNYNDLTVTSLEIMVSIGNDPQMAQPFRIVKYYNLPRCVYILRESSKQGSPMFTFL